MSSDQKNSIRLLKLALFISLIFMVGGCAFTLSPIQGIIYTGVKTPVTYKSAKGLYQYEVLGEVEGKSQATSILGIIATGDASADAAYKNALTKYPMADGLVDVCVDQTYTSFLGLFASYTTTLNAQAVKWTGEIPTTEWTGASPATELSPTMPGEQSVPVIESKPEITGPNFLDKVPPFLTRGNLGHNVNLALSNLAGAPGGACFRFGYKMRRTGFDLTFNPAVSYGSLFKEYSNQFTREFYDYDLRKYFTRKFYEKREYSYKVIPIELNFTLNSSTFSKYLSSLPKELNPFIEGGLTYYIWQTDYKYTTDYNYYYNNNDSYSGNWDFFELGLNLGLGAEFYFKPNLGISACLKRHIVFGKEIDFWNWQVGVTFVHNKN